MACGEYGEGKMSSPRQIYSYLKNYFDKKDLVVDKNFKALVTTGPTREYLDPVRYISNESSGKQGYEVALALSIYEDEVPSEFFLESITAVSSVLQNGHTIYSIF